MSSTAGRPSSAGACAYALLPRFALNSDLTPYPLCREVESDASAPNSGSRANRADERPSSSKRVNGVGENGGERGEERWKALVRVYVYAGDGTLRRRRRRLKTCVSGVVDESGDEGVSEPRERVGAPVHGLLLPGESLSVYVSLRIRSNLELWMLFL